MASSESNFPSAKTLLSAAASVVATTMVFRSFVQELLPHEFHDYMLSGIRTFLSRFSNQLTLVIDEFDGLVSNDIYTSAEIYLGPKISPSTRRLKISKPEKEKNLNITMERGEEVVDIYNGEKFHWVWVCKQTETKSFYNPRAMNSTLKSEIRAFELTFHKKNKDLVVNSYLPYVIKKAEETKQEKRSIRIFTIDYENMYNINEMWTPVMLDHPSTFQTLAMDSDQKDMILKDLEMFVQRREYYRKVGKAWKRGYLLYGPPGTGKSSLIAAMANYLNFDVYDLELTELRRNSELRKLLVGTANKSILVVEDIDCTIDLQDKLRNREKNSSDDWQEERSMVTLSGLLNFVDGLWSSCGDERIIIFTTNHVEKLDPALLRPGRMDVHIHMSYCSAGGFKVLASNYLGIKEHSLFKGIEELIGDAKVTPAEVAEQLLKNAEDTQVCFQGVMDLLHRKMKENEEKEKTEQMKENEEKRKTEEMKENEEKEKTQGMKENEEKGKAEEMQTKEKENAEMMIENEDNGEAADSKKDGEGEEKCS